MYCNHTVNGHYGLPPAGTRENDQAPVQKELVRKWQQPTLRPQSSLGNAATFARLPVNIISHGTCLHVLSYTTLGLHLRTSHHVRNSWCSRLIEFVENLLQSGRFWMTSGGIVGLEEVNKEVDIFEGLVGTLADMLCKRNMSSSLVPV